MPDGKRGWFSRMGASAEGSSVRKEKFTSLLVSSLFQMSARLTSCHTSLNIHNESYPDLDLKTALTGMYNICISYKSYEMKAK